MLMDHAKGFNTKQAEVLLLRSIDCVWHELVALLRDFCKYVQQTPNM